MNEHPEGEGRQDDARRNAHVSGDRAYRGHPEPRIGGVRVDPPRNNQRRHIRYAADYEIAKVTVVAA